MQNSKIQKYKIEIESYKLAPLSLNQQLVTRAGSARYCSKFLYQARTWQSSASVRTKIGCCQQSWIEANWQFL